MELGNFEKIKAHVLRIAIEQKACGTEQERAQNAENISELMQVIKDNIGWCISHGLITPEFLDMIGDDALFANGVYHKGDHKIEVREGTASDIILLANSTATVRTWENSTATVETRENSTATVETWENSTATVRTRENSTATVETRENSTATVETWENSTATVRTWANSTATVETRENSTATVRTRANSTATVETRANSTATVETWENSTATVRTWENSTATVETREETSLRQITPAEPDFMQPWVKLAKEEHPYAKHVAMDEGGAVWVYEGATKGVCTFEVIGFDKENDHKWRDSLRDL